jgi:hypothetical protein
MNRQTERKRCRDEEKKKRRDEETEIGKNVQSAEHHEDCVEHSYISAQQPTVYDVLSQMKWFE